MKVTYEFLEHEWVRVGDRVKLDDEEGVVDHIEKLQCFEHGLPTGDYKYILHSRFEDIIRRDEFMRGYYRSIIDIEVADVELVQARIAEFAATKLKEANKAFQSLKEQFNGLKDLVS